MRYSGHQVRGFWFDNSPFFPGQFVDCVAEDFNMVTADIGGDGQERGQDIGGIKSSAQSGFNNRQIDAGPAKVIKGQRGS